MKKIRGIRRHYRKIEKLISDLDFHFNEESWYNHWHIHLDWKGITDESIKHRRSHIKKYLEILQKIADQTRGSSVDFQCWISIDPGLGECDAIYIQTNNPHSEFPIKATNIEWNIDVPELMKGIVNINEYEIGRSKYENSYYYYIQKTGIGIPLK